ncbi:MAG: hypothetical protein Q4C96_11425 [Planctomycetia bacterium]|nr:hypothetical protein [Planctomycetia bacterium]
MFYNTKRLEGMDSAKIFSGTLHDGNCAGSFNLAHPTRRTSCIEATHNQKR